MPRREPIECCTIVVLFAAAAVVLTLARSDTAKVEPQHRAPDPRESFCALKHGLGVHGAAWLRIGMGEDDAGPRRGFGLVEERLEPAGRPGNVKMHDANRRRRACRGIDPRAS